MPVATETLPLTETLTPDDQPALSAAMREAHAAKKTIYPLGGQTSLDYGLPTKQAGLGISSARLTRVVDYPARDMTITVEAGMTMSALAKTLAKEGQRVPLDVPRVDRATIGGVIATNWSGPLRFGHGTVRDYVIGISAVDGRGLPFKGGGRVVKNVAGYDFCKLLCGSLGTLGVIAQVTLKLKPIPQRTDLIACQVRDSAHAEQLLQGLVSSRTAPASVEWLIGPAWRDAIPFDSPAESDFGWLIVALEGTAIEVEWMLAALTAEWKSLGADSQGFTVEQAAALWHRMREFSAEPAALVVKLNLPPSKTVETIALLRQIDAGCSIQAHAGNGVVIASFPALPAGGVSRAVVGRMQPAAQNAGGSCVVLSCAQPGELTRQAVWGGAQEAAILMEAIKRQFDPENQLNPGRFVYANL